MNRNIFKDLFETPQQKTYSLLIATLVVILVFFFFAIRPAYVKIAELNREISDERLLLAQINTKINTLETLSSELARLRQDLPLFYDSFPDKAENGFVVGNLSALADANGLKLSSIEFSDILDTTQLELINTVDLTNVKMVQVRINIDGNIQQIIAYVSSLERFPRIINIQSISYNHNQATETVLNDAQESPFYEYSAQLTMFVFYYTEETQEVL